VTELVTPQILLRSKQKKAKMETPFFGFLVEATGFAPLAARPARQLSIAAFAVKFFVVRVP
jgi:hypothetical protein